MSSEYLTPVEVAKRLHVETHSIRAWARKGKIRYYKFGRLLRFAEEDVKAFEEECFKPLENENKQERIQSWRTEEQRRRDHEEANRILEEKYHFRIHKKG